MATTKESGMVRLGVYLDPHRHSAVVLRAKDDRVTFVTMNQTKPAHVQGALVYETVSQQVDVEVLPAERFLSQYQTHLANYPILRALVKYRDSGLLVTEAAERVIGIAVRNLGGERPGL